METSIEYDMIPKCGSGRQMERAEAFLLGHGTGVFVLLLRLAVFRLFGQRPGLHFPNVVWISQCVVRKLLGPSPGSLVRNLINAKKGNNNNSIFAKGHHQG